jgi:hypothetical protein
MFGRTIYFARSAVSLSVATVLAPLRACVPVVIPRFDRFERDRENSRAMVGKKLNAGQRRALAILAGAGPRGCAEAILMAHGFPIEMLASLVRSGLAGAALDAPAVGRTPIEATRIIITDGGRRALTT